MDGMKRWLPFIGSVLTVGCTILKAAGYPEAADAILKGVALLLPGVGTEEQALITTAVTSMAGLIYQLIHRFNKAKDKDDYVIPIR